MEDKLKTPKDDFDLESAKYFISLTAAEKLDYLEKLNQFLYKAMPAENREINNKLKEMGF